MNENKYFDEETVEKVREYEKTDRAKAEEKKIFEQMHKKEIMAEAAKSAIDPNELLDTYIGKNSNKITGKNSNWSAFFFGSFYAFFRKMYVYGFLLMVFTSTVSIYITRALGGDRRTTDPMMVLLAAAAFYIIVDVIVGLTFNGMYLNNCMGKINEIRDRYKN